MSDIERVIGPGYELIRGDCLRVLPKMAAGSVDAVVTDPPYGIDISIVENNQERWKSPPVVQSQKMNWDSRRVTKSIPEILRISKQQIIFGGNYYADLLPPSSAWIVWNKLSSGVFTDCELAWTSHNGAIRSFNYLWDGFRKQIPESRSHPTQKPLALMVWILENYTNPGDLILDPFLGSGTTGVAAIQTGRKFIGIEISTNYFADAVLRIADAARAAAGQPKQLSGHVDDYDALPMFAGLEVTP